MAKAWLVNRTDLQNLIRIFNQCKYIRVADSYRGFTNIIRMRPYIQIEYIHKAIDITQYNHSLIDIAQNIWETINYTKWVENKAALFLVKEQTEVYIRWHPRELPNIHLEFEPDHVTYLTKILHDMPGRNKVCISPSKVSRYKLPLNQQAQNTNSG